MFRLLVCLFRFYFSHTREVYTFLHVRFRCLIVRLFRFVFCVFFHVSSGHLVLVLLAFVVSGLVSSVLSQEIGLEERLRSELFLVSSGM